MKQFDKSDRKFLEQFKSKHLRRRYFDTLQKQRTWGFVLTCVGLGVVFLNHHWRLDTDPYLLFMVLTSGLSASSADDKIKLFRLLEQEGVLKTEQDVGEATSKAAPLRVPASEEAQR